MDDAQRRLLADSMFSYCPLEQVAEQISASGARFDRIYVERRGTKYRWSLVHLGGPYPLLREVAQLLDVSYHSLVLPFGTVEEWTIVLTEDLDANPDACGFMQPAPDALVNRERILEVTSL